MTTTEHEPATHASSPDLDDASTFACPSGPADVELRFGYTMASLERLAHWTAQHKKWDYTTDHMTRYQVAWSAIAEALYAADPDIPPATGELIAAGWKALRQHHDSRRQFLGLVESGNYDASRGFERYWRHAAGPVSGLEEKITERIALAQIWPALTPASREALLALATCDNYQAAAVALGLAYRTFVCRISEARRQFLALWHEGEQPSRPWVRDRRSGPGTDQHTVTYFLRSRRLRAKATQTPDAP